MKQVREEKLKVELVYKNIIQSVQNFTALIIHMKREDFWHQFKPKLLSMILNKPCL